MFVYVLNVDVYRDTDETEWLDGQSSVFATQDSAYAYFKAWVDGRDYAIPTEVSRYGQGRFLGDDVQGFDSAGEPVFMSWGINVMEVQP